MAEFPAMNFVRAVPRFSEGVFPNIKQITCIEKCSLLCIYYPSKVCLHLKRNAGSLWKILGQQMVELFLFFQKLLFIKHNNGFGIFSIYSLNKIKIFKTDKFIRHLSIILADV